MRLLRTEQVVEKLGLSRTTLWRLERSGNFPRRRRIGANSVAWVEEEVDAWIRSRPAATASSLKVNTQ